MADLYETLGVARDATAEAIKKAFRAKAKTSHPDHGGDAAAFAEISHAYSVLIVEDKRRAYDETGNAENRAENEHKFAYALIEGMMRKVIEEYEGAAEDLICNDIVETMTVVMLDNVAKIEADLQTMNRNVERFTKLAKRFRSKTKGGSSILGNMVNYKIAGLKRRIIEGGKALEHHKKTIEILRDEAFKVDPAPPVSLNVGLQQYAPLGGVRYQR